MISRYKNGGFDSAGTGDLLPLVSVIIAFYNQPAFIVQTVLSVKRQSYPNIELIVVDDGSPISAEDCLEGVEGVTILRTENGGAPAARNYGFQHSSGEYLVFLDGDDLLEPGAVEWNLAALRGCPEATLSFGAVRVIDEHGKEIGPARVCRPRRNYFLMLLETNPIWTPGATMIRREAFVKAGMFRDLRTFQVDDYELYLQLARLGTFVPHSNCVLEYRRHSNNMSNNRPKMLTATLDVLQRVEAEEDLTLLERVQLWHGRKRWINAFRNENALTTRCMNLYFRYATAWNLRIS